MNEDNEKKGLIFDIQRFSLHDGPGIRTLIFLKGCSLRCKWCSNPESQNFGKEMLFDNRKCTECGECIKVCPNSVNSFDNDSRNIIYNRRNCKLCGCCTETCLTEARILSGKWYAVSELVEMMKEDETFFRNSGGGVTLGGGEPTFQYDFTVSLLGELKKNNINTAIETCGFIKWSKFKLITSLTDWIVFDFKQIDEKKHMEFTGVSNKDILENLKNTLVLKDNIIVRITLVPGFNDSEEEKSEMIGFIRSINKNVKIEYIRYHELGKFKYTLLERKYSFQK